MQKNTLATLITGLAVLSFSGLSAEARERHTEKKHSTVTESHSVTYRQSAPESGHSGGTFGLGVSTLSGVVAAGNGAAITGTLDFSERDSLQILFSLPGTSPFQIGGAGLYKRTIAGGQETGFHIGGGLGFGAVSPAGVGTAVFTFNITGLAGFHFSIPGLSQVRFHLDGGPSFTFYNTAVSTTQFQVSTLSSSLGASVVYIF